MSNPRNDQDPYPESGDPGEGAGEAFDGASSPAGDGDDGTGGGTQNTQIGTTVSKLERQLGEAHDRYLRLAAEYDNYRKRTSKERAEAHARGQAELVRQLIDPLDDLGRFAHLDPAVTDSATVVQGVDMVEKKIFKMLGNAGLTIVNPIDQTFDPTLHEAVSTEPALSPEDDHVVARVYQQGYIFNGQLLRPARVVVKQWNG
jgi:molecular chaperone GrpE